MSRYNPHVDNKPILHFADVWRQRSLLDGKSLFTDMHLWDRAHFDEIVEKFVNQPDEGEGSFLEKIQGQLGSASPEACMLAAELFYIMMLAPSNIGAATKIENVRTIWALSGVAFPEDHDLLKSKMLVGIGSAGTGYNNHRHREMAYAIRVFQGLAAMDGSRRGQLLADGDAFAEWLESIPENEQRQFRHMLLHLLFPDSFERFFGGTDRVEALRAFTGKSVRDIRQMRALDQDRLFREIRVRESEGLGTEELDFYESPLYERWGKVEPSSWLFAWSPKRDPWSSQAADRQKLLQGKEVVRRFVCLDDKVAVGDKAFILRIGEPPKGVVANGNVLTDPYDAPHWEADKAEAGELARYVDIQLQDLRDPTQDAYVSASDLEHIKVDSQNWSPGDGNMLIAPRSAKVLARLWGSLAPIKPQETAKASRRMMMSPARNVIFYGPPGTGKTHEMKRQAKDYEQDANRLNHDQWLASNLQDASWWQVLLMALIDMGGESNVSDLVIHPYFQAKARMMNGDEKNLRTTCWNALTSHAAKDSTTVQFDVHARRPPYVFDKKPSGVWFLVGDWQESCADWLARHEQIKRGPASDIEKVRRYEMVTFHQSYSYEDFVEGIRPMPSEDGNGVVYEVKPGIFRRLCARAKADPDHRYALFIDEINRGNVARILGELITLIEPDKRAAYGENGEFLAEMGGIEVTLPYSGERFGVPGNLDIYGAMNTADRSVAPLDAALRRRFEFKELLPDPQKIGGERGDGYIPDGEGGQIALRELLEAINARVEYLVHRDQTIGHAFFMKVKDIHALRAVLVREIIPQLQEYFYNDWSRIQLVFGDHVAATELQIVRRVVRSAQSLFGATDEDFPDAVRYQVAEEKQISPDAIRKIYQLES